MIDMKLVFFPSIEGRCHGNPVLLVLSTELIFVAPVASGSAGRANVWLYRRLHLVFEVVRSENGRHLTLYDTIRYEMLF